DDLGAVPGDQEGGGRVGEQHGQVLGGRHRQRRVELRDQPTERLHELGRDLGRFFDLDLHRHQRLTGDDVAGGGDGGYSHSRTVVLAICDYIRADREGGASDPRNWDRVQASTARRDCGQVGHVL